MNPRVERLRAFIAQRPDDPFPKYALALEFRNAGEMDEAWKEFAALMEKHADYVAAYLHAGQTLVSLARHQEARTVFTKGVEVASRCGDAHARGEIESALATLG